MQLYLVSIPTHFSTLSTLDYFEVIHNGIFVYILGGESYYLFAYFALFSKFSGGYNVIVNLSVSTTDFNHGHVQIL